MVLHKLMTSCCFVLLVQVCISAEVQRSLSQATDARIGDYERDVESLDDPKFSRDLEETQRLLLDRAVAAKKSAKKRGILDANDNTPHKRSQDKRMANANRRSAFEHIKNWAREVTERLSRESEQHGSAGLWGKRRVRSYIPDREMRVFMEFLNSAEADEQVKRDVVEDERRQQPDDLGLWGKRSRSAKMDRFGVGQPGNIGLWKGKRGYRSDVVTHADKWGREQFGEAGMWGRKRSNHMRKK